MSVSVVVKNSCKTLGESPHWDHTSQSLMYVDIGRGDVHRWDSLTGEDRILHLDDARGMMSSGYGTTIVVPSSGGGYIVSTGQTLGHLNWDTNTFTQLAEVDPDLPVYFNDGKCDAKGRLWAGTMGKEIGPKQFQMGLGCLFSLDQQKKVVKHCDKMNLSNGMAWSGDNTVMFFIDSIPGNIYAFDFDLEHGTINTDSRRTVRHFGDFRTNKDGLPDGMTVDTEGKLWVACYTKGKIVRLDPETGKILQEVAFPCDLITSCCFGGKNFDELYVTSGRKGVTEEEPENAPPLAGSIFKVTGLGMKGRPGDVYQA